MLKRIIVLALILCCSVTMVSAESIHLLWGIDFGQTKEEIADQLLIKKGIKMMDLSETYLIADEYKTIPVCGIDMLIQYKSTDDTFILESTTDNTFINFTNFSAVIADLASRYGNPTGSYCEMFSNYVAWIPAKEGVENHKKTILLDNDMFLTDPLSLMLDWKYRNDKADSVITVIFGNITVENRFSCQLARYYITVTYHPMAVDMPQYIGDESRYAGDYVDTGF